MLGVFIRTILGFFLGGSGFYSAYLYLTHMNETINLFYLILAIVLIIPGIFFLIRAGKSESSITKKNIYKPIVEDNSPLLEKTMEKNSMLDAEWTKTNDARDRLRMLELSAEAEK